MKENLPFLSIIVPAYNVEEYIGECIESILKQSFTDFELIVVDDGSLDNTGKICDEYKERDSRVCVLHKENGGLVSARKAGIRLAKGQYVTCVDGDDWIAQEMFEQMCKAARAEGADIVMSDIVAVRGKGEEVLSQVIDAGCYGKKELSEKVYPIMLCTDVFFSFGLQPSLCSRIFRHELLYRNQMEISDEISLGEDAACFYPTILQANKVVYIKEGYYFYRKREKSIMYAVKKTIYTSALLSLIEHLYKQFCLYEEIRPCLERQLWMYAGCMLDNMVTPCISFSSLFLSKGLQREFTQINSSQVGQKTIQYCQGIRTSSRTKRVLKLIKHPKLKEKIDAYMFVKYERIKYLWDRLWTR